MREVYEALQTCSHDLVLHNRYSERFVELFSSEVVGPQLDQAAALTDPVKKGRAIFQALQLSCHADDLAQMAALSNPFESLRPRAQLGPAQQEAQFLRLDKLMKSLRDEIR